MGGSQVLQAGWTSPNSLVMRIEGNKSLYDANLITVVASPYTPIGTQTATPQSESTLTDNVPGCDRT
jgi:hypothetical protein